MRKLTNLLLLVTAVLPLASCGSEDKYADKDFDGLYDLVDPTPESNISGFVAEKDMFSYELSNEILIPVDYRNFIFHEKPTYNKDLGMMMAVISNYSYNFDILKIQTSAYENEESEINPVLVQFGFKNVEHILLGGYEKDQFDVCGLYFGNNIFVNEGKKYQVILTAVQGYPTDDTWYSNFDLGADTETYYSISGEHPEWLNKKHHKGFDVTANRVFEEVKKYKNKVQEDVDDVIVAVTGHSRAGATSNLVGKLLKDNNIKSVVYAFNAPRTTQEDNEDILLSYTNIFNIDSAHDYISKYPYDHMNFTKYGKLMSYDLVEENEYYKSLFKHDFYGNPAENIAKIDAAAKYVFPSREKQYEFIPTVDEDYDEYFLCESYEQAESELAELVEALDSIKMTGQVKYKIVENEDEETMYMSPYKIVYSVMPNVIFPFVGNLIVTIKNSENVMEDVTLLFLNSMPYIKRIIGTLLDYSGMEIDIMSFACPHLQKSCIAGAYVAK